jgi:hypothetical protein
LRLFAVIFVGLKILQKFLGCACVEWQGGLEIEKYLQGRVDFLTASRGQEYLPYGV